MRNKIAKALRREAAEIYREAVMQRKIPPPENLDDMVRQKRRVYKQVKRRWKMNSEAEKSRLSKNWRESDGR